MTEPWINHHILAQCRNCRWFQDYYGVDPDLIKKLMKGARNHATSKNHYVQVEHGRHKHLNPDAPPEKCECGNEMHGYRGSKCRYCEGTYE